MSCLCPVDVVAVAAATDATAAASEDIMINLINRHSRVFLGMPVCNHPVFRSTHDSPPRSHRSQHTMIVSLSTLHHYPINSIRVEDLKAAGVDEVIVYCVNDAAVMTAWAEDQGVEDTMVTFLGDPAAELTKALDMEMTHPGPPSVGIIGRCKRFALHAINGEVKYVAVSEGPDDPAGDDDPSATLAPAILEAIKAE